MKRYWERTLEKTLDRRRFLSLLGAAGVSGALIACSGESKSDGAAANRPRGWTEATHGNSAKPDFATVFPSNKVNQITLKVRPDTWQAMLDDMTALFGARGSGGPGPFPGGPNQQQLPPGEQGPGGQNQQPPGGQFGQGPAGGNMGFATTRKPTWVRGDVSFNGHTWTNVGIRFKGNSSLRQSWNSGSDRMPFKLDFDEWEQDFPEIKNQRFYGFKQLSLSNNVGDPTHMRESLAYDVFEAAGLPAANTAFYEVLLDRGEGATSLGIYTVIEVVDDTLVSRVFGDDSGNIYEAEGSAASLAANVGPYLRNSFQKENNEDAADWSDIERLHAVLHSSKRTTDLTSWKRDLEAVFDVPMFLEFLAIAAALQHWDTYGGMTHNYYLYNDKGKLKWISWDHNFILGAIAGGGGNQPNLQNPPGGNNLQRGGPGGINRNTSLGKEEVSASQWPLIRYLLDVPEYYSAYKQYLRETIEGPFNATSMQAKYEAWAAVLQPFADKRNEGNVFRTAVQSLIQTTRERNQAVATFLGI